MGAFSRGGEAACFVTPPPLASLNRYGVSLPEDKKTRPSVIQCVYVAAAVITRLLLPDPPKGNKGFLFIN